MCEHRSLCRERHRARRFSDGLLCETERDRPKLSRGWFPADATLGSGGPRRPPLRKRRR
jgi:hypothetical protein